MTVGVNTNNTQSATVGTEHTLATITQAGVYQLMVDVTNLVDGTTPDAVELREYLKPTSGGTEQLIGQWPVFGAQSEKMVVTPPRMSAASIRYTLIQTQGTSRNFAWAVQQNA